MNPLQKILPAIALSGSFFLGACTVIGGEPVPGWPQLEVVQHHVPHRVMRDRCMRYVGFGMSPEACAEFRFDEGRCDLWFSADFPPPPFVVQHELEHCRGYEHAGETALRRILAERQAVLAKRQASQSASQGASAPMR